MRRQFLGGQRAVMVPVGRVETLFDDRQILVLTQRAVLVGIGLLQHALGNSERSGFLGVQREIVIRVGGGESSLCGDADFVPAESAVLVGVEGGKRGSRSTGRVLGIRQRRGGGGQEKSQHKYHCM